MGWPGGAALCRWPPCTARLCQSLVCITSHQIVHSVWQCSAGSPACTLALPAACQVCLLCRRPSRQPYQCPLSSYHFAAIILVALLEHQVLAYPPHCKQTRPHTHSHTPLSVHLLPLYTPTPIKHICPILRSTTSAHAAPCCLWRRACQPAPATGTAHGSPRALRSALLAVCMMMRMQRGQGARHLAVCIFFLVPSCPSVCNFFSCSLREPLTAPVTLCIPFQAWLRLFFAHAGLARWRCNTPFPQLQPPLAQTAALRPA